MRSYVIIGDKILRKEYIDHYIEQNSIKPYNVFEFKTKVTIEDIRTLKKKMAIKSPEKRIFIFWEQITPEAQNAFLKTLEELPDETNTFFAYQTKDALIPTILSRSFLVPLKSTYDLELKYYKKKLKECFEKNEEEKFYSFSNFIDNALSEKDDLQYEKIVLSLRALILDKIKNTDSTKNLAEEFEALDLLHKNYRFVYSNNLNKKNILEKVFLLNSEN